MEWWHLFSGRMSQTRWHWSEWKKRCTYYNTLLLNTEHNGFLLLKWEGNFSYTSSFTSRNSFHHKSMNHFTLFSSIKFFSFTAIGTSKGFQSFQTGVWNVAITGRTYHRLFDISNADHCLHWYLYDEQDCRLEGINRKIPLSWTQTIENDLHNVNPYVHHLRHFSSTWSNDIHAISALELSDVSVTGDFAAIMHANNTTDISP
jgi:hypothetical protein